VKIPQADTLITAACHKKEPWSINLFDELDCVVVSTEHQECLP